MLRAKLTRFLGLRWSEEGGLPAAGRLPVRAYSRFWKMREPSGAEEPRLGVVSLLTWILQHRFGHNIFSVVGGEGVDPRMKEQGCEAEQEESQPRIH